jgi:hypothetical protein
MDMIKNILLLAMGITFFAACKKECNSSTHKVGFYYLDSTAKKGEKPARKLFIDNVYKGDLPIVNSSPSCGDDILLYCTIDSKKHDLEVRDEKGELINSEYLQVTRNSIRSGSGNSCGKKSGSGSNGGTCSSKPGDDCVTFGFFN